MSANVEGIIREAIRAYRAGNKVEARQLLEKATELDAYNEQAWMWLSAVVDTPEDQRVCLENVLIINPENENAKRGLSMLAGTPSGEVKAAAPGGEPPAQEDYSMPATATSSASAIYNPANEVSADEYDDWVAGLNLGGGEATPPQPAVDQSTFDSAFASAFDDDDFDDENEHDLRQFALSQTDIPDAQDDSLDSFFDDDDFMPGDGPFSSESIGFDMDVLEETASKPPTAARRTSPSVSPVRQSPTERSRPTSSAFIDDSEFDTVSEPDPGEFFRAIPKDVRPTRLPGSNETYSPAVVIGLVVLVVLNAGALYMLLMNLSA